MSPTHHFCDESLASHHITALDRLSVTSNAWGDVKGVELRNGNEINNRFFDTKITVSGKDCEMWLQFEECFSFWFHSILKCGHSHFATLHTCIKIRWVVKWPTRDKSPFKWLSWFIKTFQHSTISSNDYHGVESSTTHCVGVVKVYQRGITPEINQSISSLVLMCCVIENFEYQIESVSITRKSLSCDVNKSFHFLSFIVT